MISYPECGDEFSSDTFAFPPK